MSNKVLFSIIIPTYNRAKFLKSAIDSVLQQSYIDWELLVVDDGSIDNTKELVSSYQNKDNRIQYIYQKNAERSAARNNGILNAKGQFVCFLDSDDLYYKEHLQNFADLINTNKEKKGLYFSGVSFNSFNSKEFVYNLKHKNAQEFVLLNTFATPRACVATSILQKENFNINIRIGEDTELWSRIAAKHPVFYHRKNSIIQIDHNNRSIHGKAVYDNFKTINYILSKHAIRKEIKNKLLAASFFNIAKFELQNKKKFKTIKFVLKSLLIDKSNAQNKLKVNVLLRLLSFQNFDQIKKIIG